MSLQSDFLKLVRKGIGNYTDHIQNPVDWDAVHALAVQQGLSAIVLDGADKMSEIAGTIPMRMKLEWIGEVLQNYESRYVAYEKSIGELAGFYAKHGIMMMVLKGYGLSLNYPNPKHRPCGDIDIWNFGKQKEADEVLANKLGIKVDTSEHHHTVFFWQGDMVENHYEFLITSAVATNKRLEPILKELAMDDSNFVEVAGEKVYLPSANFNALFLLRHMLMHFVACGIELRLLLDWGFFWEKHWKEVDTDKIMGLIREYGMLDFFNIANAICVDDLGFDSGIFPIVQYNPELKKKVLDDIFQPEYDWKDAHRLSFFPRLVFKYKRWKSGMWKRELCYGESSWESFWSSVWSHLLKPASI